MLKDSTKMEKFELLEDSVKHCKLCYGLCDRTKVLSQKNGNLNSKILFIAEAPGRYGADRTGIPLYGDHTGKTFQYILDQIGLERNNIFITNAILCNPRDNKGNNTIPKTNEIKNCSIYLNILLNILKPEMIVTLGIIALKALNYIKPHKINLKEDVRKRKEWNSFGLIPLYHPGPRARVHRDLSHQISDFFYLKELLKEDFPIFKKENISKAKQGILFQNYMVPTVLQQLITYIVHRLGSITKFKLTKLIYLIDYEFFKNQKRLFTESFYIYQNAGPLQVTLTRRLRELENFEIKKIYEENNIVYESLNNLRFKLNFTENERELIDKILNKFGNYDDSRIKTTVYLTEPMRYFLKERKKGINILNKPVFQNFKNNQ